MCRFTVSLLAWVLAAQQPPQPRQASGEEPFVLRSTTKLVPINVVAVDKKGAPIADLKSEDLQILEDGKPQKIVVFGMIRSSMVAEKPFTLPPNIYSNRAAKTGLPASVTVILLDGLNTAWEDQARARHQVLKFLSTISSEDRVALYTLGRGMRVLHDFTTDTSELIAKLDKYRGESGGPLGASALPYHQNTIQESSSPDDPLAGIATGDPTAPTLREAEFFTTQRAVNTLKAMEAIAAHLAGLPGRKSLIWVSGSFPLSMGLDQSFNPTLDPGVQSPDKRSFYEDLLRAARRLNHAGVSVYPVDARGLMTNPVYGANNTAAPSNTNRSSATPNLDAMMELASQTGGLAFYHRNDIDGAVRAAADDGRVTYTVGYYPSGEPDNKYHQVRIKVNRPGVNVRHRRGYFAYRDTVGTPATIQADIGQALWSPLDSTALAVSARVDHNASNGDLEIMVQLDPDAVSLEQREGRWKGRVDIGYLQKDEEGKSHGGQNDIITLNLTQENYEKLRKGAFLHSKRLARADRSRFLRIVARDGFSGLTGSLTVPMKSVQSYTPQPPASPPAR